MVAHLDAVTCLAADPNGVFLMSGSECLLRAEGAGVGSARVEFCGWVGVCWLPCCATAGEGWADPFRCRAPFLSEPLGPDSACLVSWGSSREET